jgi:hypothetical protein
VDIGEGLKKTLVSTTLFAIAAVFTAQLSNLFKLTRILQVPM